MLEFKEEMLIPRINGKIYYGIFELENWLKRICLTTYFLNYGPNWETEISGDLLNNLKSSKKQNEDLMYLGGQTGHNIIWSANFSQLIKLFKHPKIRDQLKNIIGIPFESFKNNLYELKNIRNLLAHNIALSNNTKTIYRGLYESLRYVITSFKKEYIYKTMDIKHDDYSDPISKYFNEKMDNNKKSNFQAFVSNERKLYSLTCLPVKRRGGYKNYVNTKQLIETYSEEERDLIGFKINKTGDEYGLLFTSKSKDNTIKNIIDIFIFNVDFWIDKPYNKQDPKYACHPKIWYYENSDFTF